MNKVKNKNQEQKELNLEVLNESNNNQFTSDKYDVSDTNQEDETAEFGCCYQEEPDQGEIVNEQDNNEEGQMTLFGALEGVTPNPAKNKKTAAITGTKSKDTADEKPIGQPVICCYAGHKITITDTALTLDQIRAKLQRDFPELTKDNTDIQYDKKAALVRIYPLGKKRG